MTALDPTDDHAIGSWAAGSSDAPLTEDGPQQRAQGVIGSLLLDPDAVRRYHTVQALQTGRRLREVQAISLHQLVHEHGTIAAAAAAVGITRQAAHELMGKVEAADASTGTPRTETPPGRYGLLLAVVWNIATRVDDVAPETKPMDRWYQLEERAPQSLALLPRITQDAHLWLKTLRHRGSRALADKLDGELNDTMAAIAEWVSQRRGTPRLNPADQLVVQLSLSSGRVAIQRQRSRT